MDPYDIEVTSGKILLVLLFATVPAAGARASDFPGVSKYSYYSRITGQLLHPMFHDGTLLADGISWRDHSVFSDALFTDLFPWGRTDQDSLSLATVGVSYTLRPAVLYMVGGGVIRHHDMDASYGKLILGAGIRQPIFSWLALDMYLQGEYDSADGFDWEVGGYPVRTPWFSASVHVFFSEHTPRIIESRSRVLFLGVEFLEHRDLDARRYALSLSRRGLAAFFDETDSSAFEWEVQSAFVQMHASREFVWETRLMLFYSMVGDGPRGEARPGIHLNLSYTSGNSSGFEGVGAEVGYGAKQIDTARTQQLYFTFFYNYAAYYYRHPSLMWGLGLTGRY